MSRYARAVGQHKHDCAVPICNSKIPRDEPMCVTHLSFVPQNQRDELCAALKAFRRFPGIHQGRWLFAKGKAVAAVMEAMRTATPTNAGGTS